MGVKHKADSIKEIREKEQQLLEKDQEIEILKNKNAELENQVTDLQMAIVEVFERTLNNAGGSI
jgi:predicted transcriptional regulator